MPIFEMVAPDGKKYRIDAPDGQAAISALEGMTGGKQPAQRSTMPAIGGDWGVMDEALSMIAGDIPKKGNAAVTGLIDSTINAAKGGDFNYSENYNRSLEGQRRAQADYNSDHPVMSGVGKGAGLALGITNMPVWGKGALGAAGTGAAYGGVMGLSQDAETLPERAYNTALGAGTGAAIGTAGYGLGKAAGWGANKLSRAWEAVNASPEDKAAIQIRSLFDDAGGAPTVQQQLDTLGPDAMNVDVLGERGRSLARNAANISPDAREVMEPALAGRTQGQNTRVVSDMRKIANIADDSTQTVDDLVKEIDNKFRPTIDRLYSQARAAGKDMPLQFFDDVLGTPQGKSAYNEAMNTVKARARLAGTPNEVSNLAVIDEMKKIFDSRATEAFASQNRAKGSLWSDFAKNLRMRSDAYMNMQDDPIYAEARSVAQAMYKAQDAVKTGESLGASHVPMNLPGKADALDVGQRQRLAQGYVAKKADALLNRGPTAGALNELSTPMGRKAADVALGPGNMQPSINRERTFNKTTRALTGNSTTARQLAEMGGIGSGTAASAAAMGYDMTTGGIAGLMAALMRKGGPALAKKMSTDAQRKAAPIIAEMLTSRGMPAGVKTPGPAFLERLSGADKAKAEKLLLMLLREPAQNTNRQMTPARK